MTLTLKQYAKLLTLKQHASRRRQKRYLRGHDGYEGTAVDLNRAIAEANNHPNKSGMAKMMMEVDREARQKHAAGLRAAELELDKRVREAVGKLGGLHLFHITADHTDGKSVGHCCSTGVRDDPTDQLGELFVAANSEHGAEAHVTTQLEKLCKEWGDCPCRIDYAPGYESWWNSVYIYVEEIGVREYLESGNKIEWAERVAAK